MGVRIIWVIALLLAAQQLFALQDKAAEQKDPYAYAKVRIEDNAEVRNARELLLQHEAEAASLKAASLLRLNDVAGKKRSPRQTGTALRSAALLFQKSARLFMAVRAYDRAADSYFQAAEIHSTLGAYDKSLPAYQESLRIAQDQALRCRASSRITQIQASLGEPEQTKTFLEQTRKSCKDVSDKTALGEKSLAEAEVLYYLAAFQTSESFYSQARSLFAESGNREREAWALLHLGYARLEAHPEEADNLAQQSLQIWSSLHDQQGIAQARQALGFFAAVQDQFESAQCNSSQALTVFHELADKDNEGAVLNNMGKLSAEIGEPEASLGYYRRARLSFAAVHDYLGEADAITGIAAALSTMGQYRFLPPLYQEKLRLAEKAKNNLLLASALANRAELHERNHRLAEAEELYRRSVAIYQSNKFPRGESSALLSLAQLQIEQHRNAEALSTLEAARVLKQDLKDQEGLARIGFEVAYVYRRMGRMEDALAAIQPTIAIIESQRLHIANFDSRAAYFAAVHQYYSLYIQVLMALHKLHPRQGFAQRAFEASERSKVRSLLDLLTVSSQNSPCDELLKPSNEKPSLADSSPSEAAEPAPSAVLDLQQIQAEIQDDDILLEYALGDESSYLWAVQRNQIVFWELPASTEVGELVKSFLYSLILPQQRKNETAADYAKRITKAHQAYKAHAAQLSRLLIGHLSLPAEKRLLIVPDGFLQSIPFSALPLPEIGKANAVLLDHHDIAVLPSASALGALRKTAATRLPPTQGIAVLADPVFEPHQAEAKSHIDQTDRQRLRSRQPALSRALRDVHGSDQIPPLPGSLKEARSIKKIFGKEVHLALGYDANRKSVLDGSLAPYRVVHFATHGIIDTRHPEMSGLVLSLFNKQGRMQDGYLRLGDIYKLKLSADLVVLSSCESALGKELESEGIIGLPRGFLYAGAKSVISTLWKVDDQATKEFMSVFYSELHARKSPAAALRRAQATLAHDPYWSNPYFWAAFVLQGEYK